MAVVWRCGVHSGNAGEVAFIKPMIAMRDGSQSDAAYASSGSAQAAGPDFRLEMEGLQYSEIPMLAGGSLPVNAAGTQRGE
ncbi:penicillin-binding protein activator [Shigella flexneri]